MSSKPHSQNQQAKSNRQLKCSRCTQSFSHQKAYYEHLRSHTIVRKTSVENPTQNETARYIAERRKNYPTADNITKKLKSDEERQERGDVLETRQFGRIKEHKTNKSNEIESALPIMTKTVTNNKNTGATLLERLLATDIRRERNMVLQSIRHIINNNFYGLDEN
ncbi:unnamed protein product [Rotaria socialis]|uniref:C2H2-type domain-containing protein n=1 Tax=Rotaria socialis TaxID=392032 RepID=A0A818EU48_9BILA|nr:unnamed protein product [Rotaria socialis]CAF3689803.1 unnamed protein product [Rotaria socialis]CAF3722517.1 unnamed protein product [Rotaria socialis]CAF4499796.1 unnamed protein product [Rotaria socialis]CAF4751200.1 unnamed protein product [Rotaria socialis]